LRKRIVAILDLLCFGSGIIENDSEYSNDCFNVSNQESISQITFARNSLPKFLKILSKSFFYENFVSNSLFVSETVPRFFATGSSNATMYLHTWKLSHLPTLSLEHLNPTLDLTYFYTPYLLMHAGHNSFFLLLSISSRFKHSIRDWRCRQMSLFVLCQEHSTDINCQCWLHWQPFKINKVVDLARISSSGRNTM
jgi:hypothetical protein